VNDVFELIYIGWFSTLIHGIWKSQQQHDCPVYLALFVCTCVRSFSKKKNTCKFLYCTLTLTVYIFCLKQRMGSLTKNGSWSAGTGNRATGWGTPSGSARPRSCAPGRCSGIVLSWSRRRSPRGRRPNSRPPNHRQVLGQNLQRFTAWFRDRHKQTLQVKCAIWWNQRRHAAAYLCSWEAAKWGDLKPSLCSSSPPFITRELRE